MSTKTRYIEVPTQEFVEAFTSKGFKTKRHGNEIVLYYEHLKETKMKIQLYTSMSATSDVARGCGEDAIRVNVILEGRTTTYPIFKGPRIYRTGSVQKVIDRALKATRRAYGEATKWLDKQRQTAKY